MKILNIKKQIFLFGFSLFSVLATAQSDFSLIERKELMEANGALNSQDYEYAKEIYLRLLSNHTSSALLQTQIGICFYEIGNNLEALSYFKEINEGMVQKNFYEFHFYYGAALQKNGQFQTAMEQYKKYDQKAKEKDKKYYGVAEQMIQCQFAIKSVENQVTANMSPLSDSINSKYNEYHPTFSADGTTMIFTSRRNSDNNTTLLPDNQYLEKVYVSKWNKDGEYWGQPKMIESISKMKGYISNTSLSSDGKTLYIYLNNPEENDNIFRTAGAGDIYVSKSNDGVWSKPKSIEEINTTFYEGGASISSDGTKLFFISNRFGLKHDKNYGGKDIFVSELQEDGTWGKPKNIGEAINTEGDEISISIHPNGKTLFFASNGHLTKNMGGYDIFKSELKNGVWSPAENLGFPINTGGDDKEFILSTDGKTGWISTVSKNPNRFDLDIFQVDLEYYNVLSGESQEISIVQGKVEDASTGLPLQANIKFINKKTGEISIVKSDIDGNYFRTILANTDYSVEIDIDGYNIFKDIINITPPKKTTTKKRRTRRNEEEEPAQITETYSVVKDLLIQRINPIDVVNKDLFKKQVIRFQATDNGYQINEFSKSLLAMYAQQLVKSKEVNLSLTGHFDDSVSEEEAIIDAQKLIDLVKAYIIKNGGDASKISSTNVGSNQPIANNNTDTGKGLNRRVEIRITL